MTAMRALLNTSKDGHVVNSANGEDLSPTTADIIDSLTQAFKSKTTKSPAIDTKIASLIDNILTGDLPTEMAKEKRRERSSTQKLQIPSNYYH